MGTRSFIDGNFNGGTRSLSQSLGINLYRNLKESENKDKIIIVNLRNGLEITIKEFTTLAIQAAISLKNLGIGKGDVVAVVSENDLKYAISVTALFFLGATAHLLNPDYSIGELKHLFNIAKHKTVLCSNKSANNIWSLREEFHIKQIINFDGKNKLGQISFDELLLKVNRKEIEEFYPTEVNAEKELAVILSSSGTTGYPKGVCLSYTNVAAIINFFGNKNFFNDLEGMVTLNYMPFFHIIGVLITFGGILFEIKTIIIEKFIPENFLKSIENYRVTVLFAVPTILQFLAQSPLIHKYDLSSIKDLFCGGAPLSPATLVKVTKILNLLVVRQMYGMSECGVIVATPLNYVINKPGSVGKIVDPYQLKICDVPTGRVLGPNKNGEILVKGSGVTVGYYNNEEATRAAFDDQEYLQTGDLGYYDEDGYFYVVDRLKEIIKYKGFQVSPAELELILVQHPGVKEAAVVGIPDDRAGELPMALVVKKPNMEVTEEEIVRYMAENISIQKQLHGGVKFVNNLPKSSLGKIQRGKIKHLV